MRYWLLQSNEVLGPFNPDELKRLAGFTPESLVCPDGRQGSGKDDWLRAGTVPELSGPPGASSAPGAPGAAPQERSGAQVSSQDRALIASLLERTASLQDALERAHDAARAKEKELEELRRSLADKDVIAVEHTRALAERRRQAEALEAQAAAQHAEAETAKRRIAGLEQAGVERQSQIKALEVESSGLHAETEEAKRRIAALEEVLAQVQELGESFVQAVEGQKRLAQDLKARDPILAKLTSELEYLRTQLMLLYENPSTRAFLPIDAFVEEQKQRMLDAKSKVRPRPPKSKSAT